MRISYWSVVFLTWFWLGVAHSAHITDKLLAGLYEKPTTGQKPVQLLPSGTPVEVLEKSGGYQRVRLADGKEGWVNGSYVTDQKPAQAKLLEVQAQLADVQEQLAQATARACSPDDDDATTDTDQPDAATAPGSTDRPTPDTASVADDCGPVEAELTRFQERTAEAIRLLAGPKASAPASLEGARGWMAYWPWLSVTLALVVGFALGTLLVQQRVSKRFGKGFRL